MLGHLVYVHQLDDESHETREDGWLTRFLRALFGRRH